LSVYAQMLKAISHSTGPVLSLFFYSVVSLLLKFGDINVFL
jgi:hypothetical protein